MRNSAGSNFNSNDHFSSNPLNVSLPRSKFNRAFTQTTSIKVGKLTPIFLDEVLPGDTFEVDMNYIMRGVTPLYPTMDNAVVDTYFFFVPMRLVWDKWEEFCGFNEDPWYKTGEELLIPSLSSVSVVSTEVGTTFGAGSLSYSKPEDLSSYLEIPSLQFSSGISPTSTVGLLPDISLLPFRAYAKIWNDWFRDQNTQGSILYSMGNNDSSDDMRIEVSSLNASGLAFIWYTAFNQNRNLYNLPSNNSRKFDFWYETIQYGIGLAPVNKLSDYFTSALPGPQKGDPVTIPTSISGVANLKLRNVLSGSANIPQEQLSGWFNVFDDNGAFIGKQPGPSGTIYQSAQFLGIAGNQNAHGSGTPESMLVSTFTTQGQTSTSNTSIWNHNANLSGYINGSDLTGTSININELRQAIALQQALEKDARGGTRYTEVIRSHFGVISPDARLQRSEYLGGSRTYIRNNQVLQTSSTDSTSPLGQTGAYSITNDRAGFVKSFTEHGYILGLTCVRVEQSYSQGIRKLWSRKRRFDFYWPVFDNIGEQPILTKEIYVNSVNDVNNATQNVFGYQEAWADYRYKNNVLTGYMKPITLNYANASAAIKSTGSLYRWTYTTNFANAPLLSNQFQQENPDNFEQTLAVTNGGLFDFWGDFFFSNKCTRVMNTYSIPGMDRI